MIGDGIQEFVNETERPALLEGELVEMVSSRLCKWNSAHLHVSRAFDLFLQCKMHYIFYIGVGTLDWMVYN